MAFENLLLPWYTRRIVASNAAWHPNLHHDKLNGDDVAHLYRKSVIFDTPKWQQSRRQLQQSYAGTLWQEQ